MLKQRGLSLVNLIIGLAVVGFLAVMAAKMMPAYIEYFAVKKMLAAMEQAGDLKGSVRDIRTSYERRNAIEDVKSVRGEDLEVTKEGGETVVSASWSCLDFAATTAK
jgi:Tfp pilus assembly major pilin PilA